MHRPTRPHLNEVPMPYTIQGHDFDFGAPRYAAGHACTENEANALNQVRLENIRNNTASKIKAAAEKASVAPADVNLDADLGDGTTLRSLISAYADNYEFGLRSVRTSEPVDPVEKEAIKLAKDTVRKALATKKVKVKDLPEGKFDEMVEAYAAREDVIKEAKRRVKLAESAGAETLDLSAFGVDEPVEEAAA